MFDKSFIEMLNADELFELSIFVSLISTPILRREILADLRKKSTEERNSLSVMKSLSEKMSRAPIEPVDYRKAAWGELMMECTVPFNGACMIDGDASHVSFANGGLSINATQVQWDWKRWSKGLFTVEEEEMADRYRKEIETFDPALFCKQARSWANLHYAHCKNLDSVMLYVNSLVDDPRPLTQEMILNLALVTVSAPTDVHEFSMSLLRAGLIRKVKDYAPFAISVTRLFLIYHVALLRGIFGPRPSDVVDLEYLYYAPFTRIFVSNDRLHKKLWPATTTKALFYTGEAFKADLSLRAGLRKEDPVRVRGPYPVELKGSVISEAFRTLRDRRN